MKIAVISFGNAGGKITDKLLWYEQESGRNLIASVDGREYQAEVTVAFELED